MNTILVPIDGSDCSDRALETAIELACTLGAGIAIVHVVDAARASSMSFGEPQLIPGCLDALRDDGEHLVADAVALARKRCSEVRSQIEYGIPAQEIERLARQLEPRMIVIGTHGRSGLNRFIMGSVAEEVLRRARVPVVVVPPPVRAAAVA